MGMDPKQERALRSGEAGEEDLPRDTSREAVREQEETGAGERPPRRARVTAAVSGTGVNIEPDTPVERLARQLGETQIPEVGRAATHKRRRDEAREGPAATPSGDGEAAGARAPAPEEAVDRDVAQQALYARREHSKGIDNLPAARPHAGLVDERPEDRTPHDLPKERDDRTAPKGNVSAGQETRNPARAVRGELAVPRGPRRSAQRAVTASRRPAARPASARPTARRSSAAKRKATAPSRPTRGRAATVRKAPKSAERTVRRAAVARRPQAGTRRTGSARRGDAVRRVAGGNVRARATKKAKASRAKPTRATTTRGKPRGGRAPRRGRPG